MFFVLLILKNFFINTTKHVFFFCFSKQQFFSKIQLPYTNFLFWKHRNLFLKTVFQNSFKKQQPKRPLVSLDMKSLKIWNIFYSRNIRCFLLGENPYLREQ